MNPTQRIIDSRLPWDGLKTNFTSGLLEFNEYVNVWKGFLDRAQGKRGEKMYLSMTSGVVFIPINHQIFWMPNKIKQLINYS